MMNTTKISISPKHPLTPLMDSLTEGSKNLRNRTLFLMRNTVTALSKDAKNRHPLEQEALDTVMEGLRLGNKQKMKNFAAKERRVAFSDMPAMAKTTEMIKYAKKFHLFSFPTKENPYLNYEQMDVILKCTKDRDYYALPSQVNQKAVRKTTDSWKSTAASMAEWKKNPDKFTGRPGFPKYIQGIRTTAQLTNQVCKAKTAAGRMFLSFPETDELLDAGPASRYEGEFIKVEIIPSYNGYVVCLTFKDGRKKPEVPENPARIMGIDYGIANFMTCATNFCATPFIISRAWLKTENQYFNKERAKLLSSLAGGKDSKHSRKTSKRLSELSRKREAVFRDFFYKAAHAVCRIAIQRDVEVLVVGKNKEWKDSVHLGEVTNQNFVSIPFNKALDILEVIASKYGLPIVVQDESYSSQASCLDLDPIPTYGDKDIPTFSGKRVHRGLYRSKNKILLNADVNGAANIIRKRYPEAFKDSDMTWLYETIIRIHRDELIKTKNIHDASNRIYKKIRDEKQHIRKDTRTRKKFMYMKLFEAKCLARRKSYRPNEPVQASA